MKGRDFHAIIRGYAITWSVRACHHLRLLVVKLGLSQAFDSGPIPPHVFNPSTLAPKLEY
eukprot:6217803-Amphidinium_carterae.2